MTRRDFLFLTRASMRELARANEAAGGFFFRPDTLRFFSSRVARYGYHARTDGTVVLFVTSERWRHDAPRRYSVRAMTQDGRAVGTVGTLGAYGDARTADRAARDVAGMGPRALLETLPANVLSLALCGVPLSDVLEDSPHA